jgi:hypothetical protein
MDIVLSWGDWVVIVVSATTLAWMVWMVVTGRSR